MLYPKTMDLWNPSILAELFKPATRTVNQKRKVKDRANRKRVKAQKRHAA